MTNKFIQPKPTFMCLHTFKKQWIIQHKIEKTWKILNKMETFTKGQVFPYRVEFISENGPAKFNTGVWTNHHGPFLNVCGQIGTMKPNEYRDLNYSYGSYVLSFRLIRPVRLQFFFKENDNKTLLTVQLDTYIAPWFKVIWNLSQHIFWYGFGSLISKKYSDKRVK